jgi:hypothetical protein
MEKTLEIILKEHREELLYKLGGYCYCDFPDELCVIDEAITDLKKEYADGEL